MKRTFIAMCTLIVLSSCEKCNDQQFSVHNSLLDVGFQKDTINENTLPSTESKTTVKLNSPDIIHYGMDISHYQGNLMKEISPEDSIKFIICKATQGTGYIDPDFRSNWREIENKGFIRGAYHFYDCLADPIAQADHFTRSIQDIKQTDIAPILDIEQESLGNIDPKQMESDILKFLKRVESNLQRKPMIYTDYAFAQEYFKSPEIASYDLWLAEYNGQSQPQVPDLWKTKGFEIWQRADNYSTYSKHVDLDVVFESLNKIIN